MHRASQPTAILIGFRLEDGFHWPPCFSNSVLDRVRPLGGICHRTLGPVISQSLPQAIIAAYDTGLAVIRTSPRKPKQIRLKPIEPKGRRFPINHLLKWGLGDLIIHMLTVQFRPPRIRLLIRLEWHFQYWFLSDHLLPCSGADFSIQNLESLWRPPVVFIKEEFDLLTGGRVVVGLYPEAITVFDPRPTPSEIFCFWKFMSEDMNR